MTAFRLVVTLGLIGLLALGVGSYFISRQAEATGTVNTLGTEGVAIRGYDPVAYFTEGAPRKGEPEFTVEHQGVKWQFASAENKALFEADPAKYTPAYGGYCAYGVAQGYLVKIEPDAWSIRDGRLYLNFDRDVQNGPKSLLNTSQKPITNGRT